MKPLRIKEAIARYNHNLKEGEEKMTQQRLGDLIFSKVNRKYNGRAITNWCAGRSEPRVSQIRKIAEVLNVDFNYLFNHQNEE